MSMTEAKAYFFPTSPSQLLPWAQGGCLNGFAFVVGILPTMQWKVVFLVVSIERKLERVFRPFRWVSVVGNKYHLHIALVDWNIRGGQAYKIYILWVSFSSVTRAGIMSSRPADLYVGNKLNAHFTPSVSWNLDLSLSWLHPNLPKSEYQIFMDINSSSISIIARMCCARTLSQLAKWDERFNIRGYL